MSTPQDQALIIVDLQPDFLPGGPLATPGGDAVIPVALALMDQFEIVVATQDWHPPDHGSFAANHEGHDPGEVIDLHGLEQILWPVHCVQGSEGAKLVPQLEARADEIAKVFQKGTDKTIDSYSGFFDNGKRQSTGLGDWLKKRGVESVVICGLALDYCVKFTAFDAVDLGFETILVRDGTRAVNLSPDDGEQAIAELERRGVKIVDSSAFTSSSGGASA